MSADGFAEPGGTAVRRRSPLRAILAVALLAFVGGALLVTSVLTRWQPARRWITSNTDSPAAQLPLSASAPPQPGPTMAQTPEGAAPEPQAVTESRVAGLEARLARIDGQADLAAANAARAEGLLIAFAARRTIDRGAALGYLEGQLRARFAGQPRAVAAVIAAAQAPVTLDLLRHRLDTIAPELIGGERSETWWDATRRILGGLIVVRRADAPSPAADERLVRARMALDSGEADKALAEIARLPARASASDWMILARRYIEAHRALDILEASALTAGAPPAVTGKQS